MVTGIEPITLPWKRPEKGVSAAELGASFRIEQREDGWHCTVRVGRRAEVLATGMRRLRDAQCRAEAHAATLPEVAAAVEKRAADAAQPAKERPTAPVEDVTPVARTPPTFESVSDGCICGKIEGGTWIADPAGKVSVPAGTDPELAQEICRAAAQHYTAQRETAAAAKAAKTAAATAARAAAKTAKAAAKTAAAVGKAAATAKTAAKTKAVAKTKTAAKTKMSATAKTAAKTAATAKKAKARTVAAAEPAAETKRGGSKAANKRAAKKGPRGRQGKGKQAKATAATAKEEPMGKRSGKANGEGCGCVTWTEVEGKARGEAKHGAFVVEPEGKRHALYFYDPDGQSRHLQSGEAAKLRKVAEEMAARGQPAPRAASASDDAAMLKMFMAGAMEDEA